MTHKVGIRRKLMAVVMSALCAAFFLMVSGTASAQLAGKGAISGTVQDPSGAAIPNATVTATKVETGVATSTTSTSAGDYSIPTLDPGVYVVTVAAQGFEKLTQQNVQVNALETQTVNPKLTVGGGTENVTVSAAPPQLETTNATLGATMENEMYSALPIEMGAYGSPDQRRATDFAFLMPGVQGNNTNGNPTTNAGIVNGSGSRGAVSDIYIDGVGFVRAGGQGDPRYIWTAISVDAVDQFQVQTAGYSAIYEGQGLQNYTVKQGGNKYHGTVYEFFRNTALDTWGFFGATPNPVTGQVLKPIEHSNEYGISLSGPLVPFGSWKNKLFAFGNYNGFRFANETPTAMTFPTAAQQGGNFQGVVSGGIYDPNTQTACTANNAGKPCRYRYGYVYSGTPGNGTNNGNPVLGPGGAAAVDVIPASEFSAVALKMQSFIPSTGISTALQNNYISPNRNGLVNWSTTDRIDYIINPKNTLTMIGAIGRQASSNPAGQTTAGRNIGPIPYNYGQTFAPKTAVGVIEETYIVTPHLVNQIKYGYARYNGPTFDADQLPQYSATTMGISVAGGSGAVTGAFPITTFAGTNPPTNWGGTSPNVTLAENYTVTDNVQWTKGRHALTFGGQTAWLLYNVVNATGGSTALTLANAATETEGLSNAFTGIASTGVSYASFLIGQIDTASYTQYLQTESGARFRAISPYVQDNWKVNSKLTVDMGLRWDFYPSLTEVHNAQSFFSPTLANPITGGLGALQFAGSGAGTCNCSTPVNNYKKNFGPRLGIAYQIEPKTVIRASYGVMFSHGNAVGGLNTSLGVNGFSAAVKDGPTGSLLSSVPFGATGTIPVGQPACGIASGPQYGTGFTTVTAGPSSCGVAGTVSYSGTPLSMAYPDPYLGSRAPEYINWTFGFQHQWTESIASTITYVGSQGHFLQTDGGNIRGFWSDQLDPKYDLSIGTKLADTGAALTADCANATLGITCPANFNTSQALSTALKPFPFQGVSDGFAYAANSNYHALQVTFNMRPAHGLTFMANYTWSKTIDDGGTFRTGYPIPAGTLVNEPNVSWKADRIERTVSTSNQPQHFVLTGVYELPFGKSILNHNAVERAVFGGFKFSEVFQAYSGSPLPLTASACPTNPAVSTCEPILNPAYGSNNARINGKWGKGVTRTNYTGASAPVYVTPSVGSTTVTPTGPFIAPAAPTGQGASLINTPVAPAYQISNAPRTAPFGIYGPSEYQLDIALVRSFPLHITEASRFEFRAEWYNVTNRTFFAIGSTQVGNAAFGQVAPSATAPRKAIQLNARLSF